jgi:ribosomal protein S18 acetylase RimI-like enzyme
MIQYGDQQTNHASAITTPIRRRGGRIMHLQVVDPAEMVQFRQVVEAYWQELMPKAEVLSDPLRQERYFQKAFAWSGESRVPRWVLDGDRQVGFVSLSFDPAQRSATIDDFYIFPDERRKGYGTQVVEAIFALLVHSDIEVVELNVRRDNPGALAFWQAQGFRIAHYRLRQYRDLQSGERFVGALSSDFG